MTSESIVGPPALVVDDRNVNVNVFDEDGGESDSEVTNDTNKPVKNEKYSACMQRDRIYDALKKKEPWLRKLLDMNDWWARASCIPFIMSELGWDDHDEIEYYMDIHVWEPETRFGKDSSLS